MRELIFLRTLSINAAEDSSNSTLESNSDTTESTPNDQPIPTPQVTIVEVSVEDTVKGDVLTIYCSNNVSYILDPLAKGKYVIAPSGIFMVYVTLDGDVLATSAGRKSWTKIGDFREFHMLQIRGMPELEISIDGDEPYYVIVYEKNMNEREEFLIPKEIFK